MEPQSATPAYTFATSAALVLEACFDGGHLTFDGGLPWLAAAEDAVGVCAAVAAGVPEWRRLHIHHSLERSVRLETGSTTSMSAATTASQHRDNADRP